MAFRRRRRWLALALVLTACGGADVACEAATPGLVAVNGDLATKLGNRKLSELTSPWVPFPNEDLWEIVQEFRVTYEVIGGTLYIETDPTAPDPSDIGGRLWVSTWWNDAESNEEFSIVDDEFYLQLLPAYDVNGLLEDGNFTITDWYSGSLNPQMGVEWYDDAGTPTVGLTLGWLTDRVTVIVNLEDARWIRVTHDSSGNTVRFWTAPDACSTWTEQHSKVWEFSGSPLPLDRLNLDFVMDTPPANETVAGGAAGLSRTDVGLVERFHFNHGSFQFDTGDWTAGPNVDGITLDGNDMLNIDVSGRGVAYRNALGSRTESFLFVRGAINVGENHGWVGAAGHFADSSNLVDAQVAFAGGAGYALIERVGGTAINVDQPTATTRSKSFETNVALWLDDSDAESRASETPPNDEATISLSTLASGFVGLFVQPISAADTVARFSHWVVMESRYATITGVASGRIVKVRLADDSVVGQATSTGGDTVVDVIEGSWAVGENAIPSNIAVFESDGTTLVAELDLTVWGGDTYEFLESAGEAEAEEITAGFFGPFNPQPTTLTGDLVLAILPLPKVPGTIASVGDLITELIEESP